MTKKNGWLARILTGVFVVFLVALMIFVFIFLAVIPDFVAPISFKIDNEAYDYTIDEFAEFLKENDYISDTENYTGVTVEGTSEARLYGDTYVLYWNTSQMSKDSEEYKTWKRYSNVGNMRLEDDTLIIVYACFGVSYKEPDDSAPSDANTYDFLKNFPSLYSGKHVSDVIEDTVWDYTFDEFIDYMAECGFLDPDNYNLMSTIGTINRIYNGIDIMWWDVENLAEGTEAYEYWHSFQEDGFIIYGGVVYMPTFNGPFAIYANSTFPGNTDELYEAFAAFPDNYSKKHEPTVVVSKTVWDYTFDEFIDYMDQLGYFDKDNYNLMSAIGTINRIYNGVDVIWWDVENLVEGTEAYEYWQAFQEDGYIIYGTMVYTPVFNGPFAIYVNAQFSGNMDELYEAFNAFPKNYTPSDG